MGHLATASQPFGSSTEPGPFRLLLAEDDELLARQTARLLRRHGFLVDVVADGDTAWRVARNGGHDVVLLDVHLPKLNGLSVLQRLHDEAASPAVVIFSGYLDVPTTLKALQQGAHEILEKPVPPARLVQVVKALEQQRGPRPCAASPKSAPTDALVGRSPAIKHLRAQLQDLSPDDSLPVLIVGETGTGKDVVANIIHQLSGDRGPLVAVNCAAVPRELFESQLFGHEAGAFTGAHAARPGLLTTVGEGTLFLDEIGEMPAPQQAKLLRALENRSFLPVGATRERPLRARIISATNRPLRGEPGEPVRSDLFFRLSGATIRTTPLRERLEDVEPLAVHFLQGLATRSGSSAPTRVSARAAEALCTHHWPGNVRELRMLVRAAAARCSGREELDVRSVVEELSARGVLNTPSAVVPLGSPTVPTAAPVEVSAPGAPPASTAPRHLRDVERELIEAALQTHRGNVSRAARQLGLARSTLRDKIKRYGLD